MPEILLFINYQSFIFNRKLTLFLQYLLVKSLKKLIQIYGKISLRIFKNKTIWFYFKNNIEQSIGINLVYVMHLQKKENIQN